MRKHLPGGGKRPRLKAGVRSQASAQDQGGMSGQDWAEDCDMRDGQGWPDDPWQEGDGGEGFDPDDGAQNAEPGADRILDRYQPLYEAGSGGFAHVVVAYDTRMRREVAIKCIPLDERQQRSIQAAGEGFDPHDPYGQSVPDDLDDPDAADGQGFFDDGPDGTRMLPQPTVSIMADDLADARVTPGLREARAAARLNSPAIVQVFDFEVQDDTAYLIMENVDGLSLGAILRDHPHLVDADVAAAVFKAVAKALQTAHAEHVLHLDIKPDNVLISRKGEVKVVDFGLARLADEGGFGAAAGGTVGYMPIEQMRREELDVRCDEWSLASSLYEMLTGSNNFVAPSIDQAEDLIFDAELVLPSLSMEGLDPDVDDILFCALEPYREDRYDTVKEFAREMQPCLGDPKKGVKKLAQGVSAVLDGWESEAQASGHADSEAAGGPGGGAGLADVAYYDDFDDDAYDAPHGASHDVRTAQAGARAGQGAAATPAEPFDPFAPQPMNVWLRVLAVLGALALAAVALNNIPMPAGWADPLKWGVLAVVGVVAAAFPHAGAMAALLCFSGMLVICSAPLAGALTGLAAVAWWALSGRHSLREQDVVLAPALVGSFGFAAFVPFFAGWLLRPAYAMVAAGMAGLAAFMLAGLGSETLAGWDVVNFATLPLYNTFNESYAALLTDPSTWITVASWVGAAGLMALFCNRGTRAFAVAGSCCAFAVLLAGVLASAYVSSGMASVAPDSAQLVPVILAGFAALALSALGVPPREDEWDV